jgi:hypothetical protein
VVATTRRGHCLTIGDGISIPETLLKGFVPRASCSVLRAPCLVLRALCFISAVARRAQSMGEGTASMIEETLLKGLSPGLVHRSRTNVTSVSNE